MILGEPTVWIVAGSVDSRTFSGKSFRSIEVKLVSEHSGNPQEGVGLKSRQNVLRPRLHRVLLHNDNYTTMEFVVDVLQMVFHRATDEAQQIMLNVHEKGVGVAGVYTASVAETKVSAVNSLAQEHGFPLKCSHEPE